MIKRRQTHRINRWLRKYTLFHLILIAAMAALGVGVKPIVSVLANAVTGPFIPGGAAAGGIYMLFLVLAASLTGARGAGTLCGLCQGLLVLAIGMAGSHGALSLVTYTLPGLAADLMFLIFARKEANLPACCFAGMLANLAGTVSVNFVFFSMPLVPLLLSLCAAALSGGLGDHKTAETVEHYKMKKRWFAAYRLLSLVLLVTLPLAFAGCGERNTLFITGDCEFGAGVAARRNYKYSLEEMVALAKPRAEDFDILLISSDGMIARISGAELPGCELIWSKENAWELKSELHPPSARVKNLAQVAVVNGADAKAGYLVLNNTLYPLKEEGTSHKNGRGVTVYTTRLRVPLTGGQDIEAMRSLAADAPDIMITEVAHDALRFLAQDGRVMVIELDGLGWEMLLRADAPYLWSLEPKQALACWPPISNVGLASMLTGANPDMHGVHSREDRAMDREDIFAKAEAMGKTCAYIEGGHALLQTSIAPVLSLSDEEVFANAQKALESNPDLIFVHFHEIDGAAHAYGPYAAQTMLKIEEMDGYARALCESFDGRVIITADHGLHETEEGGGHGLFLPEDMLVPYIIK